MLIPVADSYTGIMATIIVQPLCFWMLGLYHGIWRYSSVPDLVRIMKAATIGVILSFLLGFLFDRLVDVPRSVFLIQWFVLVMALGGGRLVYRMLRDKDLAPGNQFEGDRTIIIGAGRAGEQLFREVRSNPALGLYVIGFVDDDPQKKRRLLHGAPVLGKSEDLPILVSSHSVDKVFIAIPSASSDVINRLIHICKDLDVEIKTLPRLADILKGRVEFQDLREVQIEDLLGRQEVILDSGTLGSMITNATIFVSGAGGSIGSELCRQIARFKPSKLVMYEICEFNLYSLEMKMNQEFPDLRTEYVVGDIRDQEKVSCVIEKHAPKAIFHAAAYKHVPIMESNPDESIKTNIEGTRVLATEALNHGVEKFVMISTDKAVNPTNVMGATKRVAEMICQSLYDSHRTTKFMTVRFGNVLDSSGSVIPLFRKQIKKGGPVTVTHPDITRYFMSIPEACRLVLQAGSIGKGGEIFILDMGEPVKIVDLAHQMIRLSGLEAEKDIHLEFIGLRPGEKLYEELFSNKEETLPTIHPLLRIAKHCDVDLDFEDDLGRLLNLSVASMRSSSRLLLQKLVPEYKPQDFEVSTSSDDYLEGDGNNTKTVQ